MMAPIGIDLFMTSSGRQWADDDDAWAARAN